MNTSIVRYIVGMALRIEAALMLFPCLIAIIYHETEGFAFLIGAAICIAVGFFLSARKPKNTVFYLKEGCAATALSWIFLSVFGAIPYVINGDIPNYVNAVFETVSGLTTTGASILTDIESLSHCSLLWRSLTNWIGGMGVLVFLLMILPMSGGSYMNLMRAESPGPSVGKLVPKLGQTARILYKIYIGLTVAEFVFLLIGRMPVFDALNFSLATAGTGGFAVKNDSMAGYSTYLKWVVTAFMIMFGVNFNAYYFIIYKKFKKAFKLEEVRCYFIIMIAAMAAIVINTASLAGNLADTVTDAAFQVASLMSSSGFATADFDLWPATSRTILVIIMFIGACAGSTGGGIKVSRVMIMVKSVIKELSTYIHPKSVRKVHMDGKPVEHEVVRSVHAFFISFMVVFAIAILIISFDGKDLVTNFTAVIATFNNIGPGLSVVGPTGNYESFSVLSKLVLMFLMLAGRLELFPMLVLLHPMLWKDTFTQKRAALNAAAQKNRAGRTSKNNF